MKHEPCKTCPILEDCDTECDLILSQEDKLIITNPNYNPDEDFNIEDKME